MGSNGPSFCGHLAVKRIHKTYSKEFYDKRKFADDRQDSILLGYHGKPASNVKNTLKPVFNENIIGYMVIDGSNFDNPDLMSVLIRCGLYKGHGFYLRRDNFMEKLPMFCASRYITYNHEWTQRGRVMKSADGSSRFNQDIKTGKLDDFLYKCLLFTCLENQNHMIQNADGNLLSHCERSFALTFGWKFSADGFP